jgi:hypothetical protein
VYTYTYIVIRHTYVSTHTYTKSSAIHTYTRTHKSDDATRHAQVLRNLHHLSLRLLPSSIHIIRPAKFWVLCVPGLDESWLPGGAATGERIHVHTCMHMYVDLWHVLQ